MSKTLSECPEIEVQDIDHRGIVAGIVDEIGIVELIDELIPSHELEKISAGQIVNELCQTLLPEKFSPAQINGYSFCEVPSAYGNIEHHWIIVESEQRMAADLKSLEEKINKKFQEDNRRLATLCHEDFACETDAQQAALKFEKTLKFHQLQTVNCEKIVHYSKSGRPDKQDVPSS